MDIAFVTPAIVPLTGDSELAHISGALPKALRGLNHTVRVFAPMLGTIEPDRISLARRLKEVEVDCDGEKITVALYDGRLGGGASITLLANDEFFGAVDKFGAQGDDQSDLARRTAVFAAAASELIRTADESFDLVHAHGWPGAAVLDHLKKASSDDQTIPSVLSLHDSDDVGLFSADQASRLDVPNDSKDILMLQRGIDAADRIVANSETYAGSLLDEEGTHALKADLQEAAERFMGIRRGVDAANWNPATDSHLAHRFSPTELVGKASSKASLQEQVGLPVRDDLPLLGLVLRGHAAAGLEAFEATATELLRNDVQLMVCADEEAPLHAPLIALAERFPDRLAVESWSLGLEHQVTGSADLLIIPPSEAEVGGQHLHAHRYGTLPIAPRVGAVADAVIDCDGELRTGNGFTYLTADELLGTLQRAVAAFAQGARFDEVRKRAMRVDHSWERSARHYEHVYRDLLEPTAEA